MMPASKHGDPQLGVDVHLCVVPPSPSPVPLPTPHTSIVFDPFDYVPILGATVTVCGMKRATAGTGGIAIHIPPGFPFAPKLPDKDDELFMGSSTVVADGDPFSYIALPVLSCQVAGMMSPFRPKKKGGPKAMVLPTVFNLAIPTTVFVGGPPTISLMGLAFKGAFAALGKFAKSGLFKRIRQKLFKNMNPGFLKCKVLRAEPVNILTGEVSVEQEDFTLRGRIPIQWVRSYSSSNRRSGACGYGWESPADIRLEVDPMDGTVSMRHPTAGPLFFPRLPVARGDAGAELELLDGARLIDDGDDWIVRTKEDRAYQFSKARARTVSHGVEYPIARISDLCGNWLDFEWRGGRLSAIHESAGRRLEFVSDADRIREISLYDSANDQSHVFGRYEYDAAGDLVAAVDALGSPYRYVYTGHHLARHTDRRGLTFHYEYEPGPDGWRVVHAWGDGGLYDYRFAYDDVLHERRIIDSYQQVSLVKLDERGLPIAEIDPLGGLVLFEHDESGRTVAVVDQDGLRTAYAYDDRGNLIELTRADGSCIATSFDESDRPVRIADANGAVWQQRWNDRGLLVEQAGPLGGVSRYEYDDHGQLIGYVDRRGSRTTFSLDKLGNPSSITDPAGQHTRFSYDVFGNLTSNVDPLGRRTSYSYDAKSRLTAVTLPSGAVVTCAYDPEDDLVRYVDENGGETRLEYVGLGEIALRVRPDGAALQYEYDTEERLTAVVNERGESYRLVRDALGRVVEEIDYWGQPRRYRYSAGGRIEECIDPLGRVMRFTTDPLGRVIERTVPDPIGAGPWIETFAYDATGRVLACANPAIRVERSFDLEGRLLEEKQGAAFTIRHSYDEAGNRILSTTELNAAGTSRKRTTALTYDLLGRPVAVTIDDRVPVTLAWNAAGQLVSEQLTPTLRREIEYDPDGFLRQQRVTAGERECLTVGYSYDAVGNLTERHDSERGIDRYAYDPAGRLTTRLDPSGRLNRYLTDPVGDRLHSRVVEPPASDARDSDALGRSHRTPEWWREGQLDGASYSFDRAGNLVQRRDHRGPLTLTWNANQQLMESSASGATTRYDYDPLGRRIGKRTGESSTSFFWDGNALVAEAAVTTSAPVSPSPDRIREWEYLPRTFEPLAMTVVTPDGESVAYYHNDPNGCPVSMTDDHGKTEWSAAYGAWGDVTELSVREIDNPIRLQGQYEDEESSLYYNRYRYFAPDVGQFVSQDPLRLGAGPHLYAYGPNSTSWADPLGLTCVYRFHTAGNPASLLPNLARAGWVRRTWVNFLMNFRWYRDWRAHRHMRGDTKFSPFVSVVTDPNALANSTDPWARTITTGSPGLPNVERAPDLSSFEVPPDRLIGPRADNVLSNAETEMVTWGNDLGSMMTGTGPNPH